MNRFWSLAGKAFGSFLLCGGAVVSIGLSALILLVQPPTWALTLLILLLIFLGLTPSALGGLLLYASSKANRHAIRDRFFQLLHLNQGRVSVLDFSRAARLEPAIARRHLDGWAREYDADFEVTETGEIYYVFSTEPIPLPGEHRVLAFRYLVKKAFQDW